MAQAGQNGGNPDRSFVRKAMKAPMLEAEHELNLARRWREQDDESALHELTTAYMRLVISMASKFRHYGLPLSDLVQEGNVGLMQAAARFDADRDVRFSTYASWWIRSAMQDYILRNWSIVRTGTTAAQKSLFFNLRRLRAKIENASSSHMSGDNRAKIAKELGVEIHEVEAMEMRMSGSDQSLHSPIAESSEDSWIDFLEDERPSPEDVVVGMRDSQTRSAWLAEAIGELSDREQKIIRERRLTDEGATLEELGQKLGVSKERVRQLEHRALLKLKASISKRVDHHQDVLLEA